MSLLETLDGPQRLAELSMPQLEQLAEEIRRAICDQVSRSGGHLAPNLGVVELTIALHRVFDFTWDRLLFDVGHQCYPHKLLTGRLPMLEGLRTRRGMAGFPEPDESPYDLFRVGHAGTGISTAVGMARGDTLAGEGYDPKSRPDGRRVVTLVGDASIVNGVAMEGLNNAGTLGRQFLVVLNDNGMSIAGPQGALAQHFDRIRVSHTYTGLKRSAKELLRGVPGGSALRDAYHRMGEAAKAMVADAPPQSTWFEHFGLLTVGPIDGHHLPTLVEFLEAVRDLDRPCLLHVKTVKGKGFAFAEGDARTFHSPQPFQTQDGKALQAEGCRVVIRSGGRSFTSAFGQAMLDLMARDESVVACTAAMPDGTGLTAALERYPQRVWDTGICESHALDMMAGLAKTGFKPFFAVYSTFLQRAYDQAFQEAALQGLPVRLCLDRAGYVGGDGAVHHGFADVALLRTLPDAAITAAIDEPSLRAALEFMLGYERGLSSVRYPRDTVCDRLADRPCPPFELGKARLLTEPTDEPPDAAILAFGVPVWAALDAAEALQGQANVAVYDARFAKPVDRSLLRSLAEAGVPILTVEEHTLPGGFGSAVLEALEEMGLLGVRLRRVGMPDRWIKQDSRKAQLAEVGLDAAGIERQLRALLAGVPTAQAQAAAPQRAGT
ncbi:MAG: 1-deoxy-D-xylulose-5-phosphate synthase 2 [Phycisphaerales bacterium]|nr:MAG: 1-deoxy-D-xylulose-5-phosphate synthase 2 [Phycisphaerales bacterium]